MTLAAATATNKVFFIHNLCFTSIQVILDALHSRSMSSHRCQHSRDLILNWSVAALLTQVILRCTLSSTLLTVWSSVLASSSTSLQLFATCYIGCRFVSGYCSRWLSLILTVSTVYWTTHTSKTFSHWHLRSGSFPFGRTSWLPGTLSTNLRSGTISHRQFRDGLKTHLFTQASENIMFQKCTDRTEFLPATGHTVTYTSALAVLVLYWFIRHIMLLYVIKTKMGFDVRWRCMHVCR